MSVLPRMKFPSFKVSPLKAAVATACLSIAGTAVPVQYAIADSNAPAQSKKFTVNIGSGSLGQVLGNFAAQTGMALSFDASASAFQQPSQGLRGDYSLEQGFKKLLQGTGITWKQVGPGSLILQIQKNTDTSELDKVEVIGTLTRFGDAPPEVDGFKAEYQTTATKMAMSLKETPQAISVVTQDLMNIRQVNDLTHALELTSGTAGGVGDTAAPGGPFGGRGFRSKSFAIRSQFLGPNDVRTDGFAASTLAEIDLSAYERVEVIKGPTGFYGQGRIGGFINLSRKKPKSEYDASISGQVGSYGTHRLETDMTGALNDDESLRARLVMVHGEEGSFVDNTATDTTLIAPSFEAVLNDKTRLLLQMLYQKEEFDINHGFPAYTEGDRVKILDLPRSFQFGATGDERSKSDIKDISLRIDHELSDRWLTSLLLQRSESSKDIIEGNYGTLFEGEVYIYALKEDWSQKRWAGELRLEGAFDAWGQEHKVVMGAERNKMRGVRSNGWGYFYDSYGSLVKFDQKDIATVNFKDFGVLTRGDIPFNNKLNDTTEQDNSAAYAQLLLNLTDRTKLLINARYDRAKFRGRFDFGTRIVEKSDDELTMRLGLMHALNDNLSFYATYGESFTPNIYARGQNDEPLDAQRGEGYELGLKSDWFDNKLGATLSVYRQDLTNRPVTISTPGPSDDYSIAAGLNRTEGIEFELNGSPFPGLNLVMTATWMDNEFLDENDPFYGLAIDGSLKHHFSLYANYELQTGPLKGLATGLTWIKSGDQQLLPYNDDTDEYSQVFVDGYERLDLDFSYNAVPNWDLSLVIRNVTDETYLDQCSSRNLDNECYLGAPRSALFKATYNF